MFERKERTLALKYFYQLIYKTWKVSAPEGGANLPFFVLERKNGLFWKPC